MKKTTLGLLIPMLLSAAFLSTAAQAETQVVTTTEDDGPGSLRQAIQLAGVPSETAGRVEFAPGLSQQTIVLRGPLVINTTLTIVAPDGGITLQGDADRVFIVRTPNEQPMISVRLEGLYVTSGVAPFAEDGGAILSNDANLTLWFCNFAHNSATRGGAVAVRGGSFNSEYSVFDSNLAEIGAAADVQFASLKVLHSVMRNGRANMQAGALFLKTPGLAIIEDSSFTQNNVISQIDAGGGAIFADLTINEAALHIARSTFASNVVTVGPYTAEGGALWIGTGPNTATSDIENSTFVANQTSSPPFAPPLAGRSLGGAIYVDSGRVALRNNTLAGNLAIAYEEASGGGIYLPIESVLGSPESPARAALVSVESTILHVNAILACASAGLGCAPLANDVERQVGGSNILAILNSMVFARPEPGVINGDELNNIYAQDPLLGLLQNNGGFTDTLAIDEFSPARSSGSNSAGLSTDQRGGMFVRSFGSTDIGAFEYQPVDVVFANGFD